MGNFTSCCKINDNEINIDDTKLHIDNTKLHKKINDYKTSPGPPIIVGRTVVDELHVRDDHLDLVPYLN
jgi:hypothetical protein